MKIFIMAAETRRLEDTLEYQNNGQFRKATTNMILAASAVSALPLNEKVKSSLGLVVGSSYGEIKPTNDFLLTLADSGLARPFLFQSSLNNATSGFLTMHFGICGPSLTVSRGYFTGENALEAGVLLLQSGQADCAVVLGVESFVPEFDDVLKKIYPNGTSVVGGCTGLLIANDEGLKLFDRHPIAKLKDVKIITDGRKKFDRATYHDSDGLEMLAKDLFTGEDSNLLQLIKPDGTYSEISWTK